MGRPQDQGAEEARAETVMKTGGPSAHSRVEPCGPPAETSTQHPDPLPGQWEEERVPCSCGLGGYGPPLSWGA